jgi:hypothetical protein
MTHWYIKSLDTPDTKKTFRWCKIALDSDSEGFSSGLVRVDKASNQWFSALIRAKKKRVLEATCVALQQCDLEASIINRRRLRGIITRQLNETTSAFLSYYSLDNEDFIAQVKTSIGANDDVDILIARGSLENDAVTIYAPDNAIELRKHILFLFWPEHKEGRKVKSISSNLTLNAHDSDVPCSGLVINLLQLLEDKNKKKRDTQQQSCACVIS